VFLLAGRLTAASLRSLDMQMQEAEARAIEQVKAGNAEAFRVLVDRHSRTVFRIAYRIVGNEADAEDVVQEAFMRAYRQIAVFEERASFATWISRIASNYALDVIRLRGRHEQRRVRSLPDDEQDMLDNIGGTDPGADRLYYGTQVQRKIGEALNDLSAQERAAFLLRHCEGKSIEEIGSVLGTAPSATKNSIFRAVKKLREALQPVVSSSHAPQ
jgi:RNA polymerase sigma-70 factor, ECF subfamily